MSTTAVTSTRPAQALRQRRESQRPGIARVNTRATTVETDSTPALPVPLGAMSPPSIHDKDLMAEIVKTAEYILKKFSGKRPSLILHIHPTHFRFDQQDGSFTYNSPMRVILEHLKDGTVPHMIVEELLAADVPWYDGCLIVEVHDHKTGAKSTPANATNQVGGNSDIPFSVNNYNEHITPSSSAPFPADKLVLKPAGAKAAAGSDATNGVRETDKENMPAPDQPASATLKKQARGPRVFTTVLFPTVLSFEEEKSILARTAITDARTVKRILQANSRDGMTPTLGQPPTPLASVPSTPLLTKSAPRKPKMALDETNYLEFEAEVLRITNPKLYLEPPRYANEGFAILQALAHPLHSHKPASVKTRKRTVAELAADEAQAASDERFIVSLDERHGQSAAAGGVVASDAQAGVASFEPTFKRFKTLENIKIKHADLEREKKEAAAREAHMKRQQSEADALKKQELDRRQAEQKLAQEQARVDLMKQQQIHQRALAVQQAQAQAQAQAHAQAQAQATPITSHPQHMNMMPATTHPQPQQGNATHMSPVLRQASQTPMSSSPMLGGPAMSSMPMTSVPMSATASTQGVGSPARPPTAMSAHPNSAGMARQVSQQHQLGSGHGTPQILNTPSMGPAVPVSRNMTPQPRGVTQQGSPIGGMQGTPMMATLSHQPQMTPEQQRAAMMQAQQMRLQQQQRQAALRNNPAMQSSPQNMQQMLALQQHQQQAQQMGGGPPGQQNQQMMANRQAMLQQLQMQQQNGMQQGSPNNMMAMPNQAMAQNPMQQRQNNPMMAQISLQRQKFSNQYQAQKQQRSKQFLMEYGNNPDAIPPQARSQFAMMENQKYQEFQSQVSVIHIL